jgi:mRNA interferase HicA
MKRSDLLRHLASHGCRFVRQGSRHTIVTNPANGVRTAVPRHCEIPERLTHAICRQLGIPVP